MGENSKIAWTDHTFNPWIGCTKVSEGCKHCYAESLAKRTGLAVWGDQGTRRITSPKYWLQLRKWALDAKREGTRKRVFCASLADLFEAREELMEPRARLWGEISATCEDLDYLLLTKRPENIAYMLPARIAREVWLGITAENQRAYEERYPYLNVLLPRVRFVSHEPALESLIISRVLHPWPQWIITGAESGGGARPFKTRWAREMRDQCMDYGIPFFYKQDAINGRKIETPELDGRRWMEFPTK